MFAIFLNSLRRLTGSVLSGGLLLLLAAPSQALTVYKYVDQNGVVTYSDQAVAGAQVFVFRDRMVERLDLQVKLETKKHAAGETLLVTSDPSVYIDLFPDPRLQEMFRRWHEEVVGIMKEVEQSK